MLVLYILEILILLILSFANVRFGKIKLNQYIVKGLVVGGVILTLYLYYSSLNAIDSDNYQASFGYIGAVEYKTDPAYFALAKIVKSVWNNYQILRLIVGIIHVLPILLLLCIDRKRINVPLFFMLNLLFPYFQNMVALKNTIASTVVIVAFILYFRLPKRKLAVFMTAMLLFLASAFHDSAIIYLILFCLMLLLKRIADLRKNYYLLFGIIGVMTIVIRSGIANNVLYRFAGDTNLKYISRIGTIGFGFLIISVIHVVVFYLVLSSIRQVERINGKNPYFNDIMLLFYSTLILIPLYSINVLFFRLFRNVMIFAYLIISENENTNSACKNQAAIMCTVSLLLMLFDANGIGSIESIMLN